MGLIALWMLVLWLTGGVLCAVWPSTVHRYFSEERGDNPKTLSRETKRIRILGVSLILSGLVCGVGLVLALLIAVSAK